MSINNKLEDLEKKVERFNDSDAKKKLDMIKKVKNYLE